MALKIGSPLLPSCDTSRLAQVTPYASDELVLIVPRHHELAKRSSIAVGELQSLSLVSLNQVHTEGTLACSVASASHLRSGQHEDDMVFTNTVLLLSS